MSLDNFPQNNMITLLESTFSQNARTEKRSLVSFRITELYSNTIKLSASHPNLCKYKFLQIKLINIFQSRHLDSSRLEQLLVCPSPANSSVSKLTFLQKGKFFPVLEPLEKS